MTASGYVCRACGTPQPEAVPCPGCGARVEIIDGIPIFTSADTEQKAGQAEFFDEAVEEEFEIERPVGTPRFHAWLLGEKFLRAVNGVDISGRTVLVVCGGSGMDAEFLARRGGRVVTSDVSIGAARRARERAARHGLSIESIVADVEHLPFGDASFDIVYVHDGLHHLDSPLVGLVEMARVARETVCVTEPAAAGITALAVRLGLALETEEAGNRVGRLTIEGVAAVLEQAGFEWIRGKRYAMLYRHEPGFLSRLLSLPVLYRVGRLGLRTVDLLIGAHGNKLVVVARR